MTGKIFRLDVVNNVQGSLQTVYMRIAVDIVILESLWLLKPIFQL